MRFLSLILTVSVICTAYIGDYVVFNSKLSNSLAFRAVSDSIVHASLGLLSALLFFSHDSNISLDACVYNVMFCTIVSSLIDIDHVFVARSFYLKLDLSIVGKTLTLPGNLSTLASTRSITVSSAVASFVDLTGLQRRGIFHCTTFWLLITILLLIYSYISKKLNVYTLTFMIIIAYTSHHLRDGNRRGIWLFPLGHSPALSKNLYVFILIVIPHTLAYVYSLYKVYFYKNLIVDYNMIV